MNVKQQTNEAMLMAIASVAAKGAVRSSTVAANGPVENVDQNPLYGEIYRIIYEEISQIKEETRTIYLDLVAKTADRVASELVAPYQELTIKELAIKFALPYSTLAQAVREGRVKARKVGRQWMASPSSVSHVFNEAQM